MERKNCAVAAASTSFGTPGHSLRAAPPPRQSGSGSSSVLRHIKGPNQSRTKGQATPCHCEPGISSSDETSCFDDTFCFRPFLLRLAVFPLRVFAACLASLFCCRKAPAKMISTVSKVWLKWIATEEPGEL
ncbi:Os02g0782366 [Oryza sativa Japonica Group]|uniref:Os02g0782366 protein n=1 Tax=Oryza sativa subsp. japonica TaxID=39947 RepID=A0A0P0VQF8_ORYSJ|nr:Os02g0782366 [Oryza sativa Japonica Group]